VYAFAAAVIAVAVASGFSLTATIFAVQFVLFAIAVLLLTWFAGPIPGIVTLLGCVALGNLVVREPAGRFTLDVEATLAATFTLLVGIVIIILIASHRAALKRERREHERRLLLAEVGSTLDRSLDYETTLATVARQMVPQLADWCTVYVLEDGALRRIATAAEAPEAIVRTQELARRYPVEPNAQRGVAAVVRTGKPELYPRIDRSKLDKCCPDEVIRTKLITLGVCSYMVVPIRREDGAVMGAIGLAMADSGRSYEPDDLDVALALGSRAALAIEHARLYREAQTERARAEQASHAKDQFLAMLGHELRNPLAPIRTALELMEMRDGDAFKKERRVITRQLDQLMSLVDDLLDVSRIARGKVELHREPLTLHEIVTKGVELASPLIESRQHQLRVDSDPDLLVDGDPARLAQVVSNLVVNAAKYTEPGGVIEVTGRRVGHEAQITVHDNGIGIAADMLPHLFDMFVQAPQALDRSRGGLGLGLAIVKNLVELHGGRARAHSEGPGKGSTFEVTLPALAEHPVVARSHQVHAGTHRVLVVDDNPDALSLLADALELRGYQIARAHDGPSALAVASQVHPEVALLDIGLPVMDGYELARRLRETDTELKLVAVTGYDQPGDFERTHRAGFSAHLVKPISLDRVQQTIDRLVQRAEAESAGAVAASATSAS